MEYKRPDETLTERMVWKSGGYGSLLIGTTSEAQYEIEDVTISVFASRISTPAYECLRQKGMIFATDVKGVYRVEKITAFPFQIILSDELQGAEYAAYRVLSDHARVDDVEIMLVAFKSETGEKKNRLHRVLNLVELKNPGIVAKLIEGDAEMESVFMKVLEPQVNARIVDATTNNLYKYVSDGVMPVDYAARERGISRDVFINNMRSAGYNLPQQPRA